LQIVRHHHERWDGSGYPDGLARTEIPLGARIFAVADALDAITSDRPYRRAQSWESATAEIVGQAGRQFDPSVVQAFRERQDRLRRVHYEFATAWEESRRGPSKEGLHASSVQAARLT
jgi:HD-GYP domain-containing protein (c-di-GMP phosphodiesterase class II)